MDKDTIVHILRNPYGWSEEEKKEARLEAADIILGPKNPPKQIPVARKLFRDECKTNETFLNGGFKIQYIEWLESKVEFLAETGG